MGNIVEKRCHPPEWRGKSSHFELKGDNYDDMDRAWNEFEEKHATQTDESVIRLKAMVKVAFAVGYERGASK